MGSNPAYNQHLGNLSNASFENVAASQALAVGATKAQATVTVIDYTKLRFQVATISGTITYGAPSNGDTIVITGLPTDGTKTFTKAASAGAAAFSSIAELTALIDALTDLSASDDGTTITIVVVTKGTAMNSATITGTGAYVALSLTFSGGQDAAVLTVKGHALIESTDWNSVTNNNTAADNLAAAIDALSEVSAANPAAAAITVLAATEGELGNEITLATSDATNLTISGATLAGATYLFDGYLSPAPIMDANGYSQAPPSFTGSTFITEVESFEEVNSSGKFFVSYQSGRYRVWTPDGQAGSVTASWVVKKLKVDATLVAEDVEIGAVEIKDGTADTRVKVAATGSIAEGDAALAVQAPVLGVTTGAAVVTDAAGTIQQFLRGLVKLIVAKITVILDSFGDTVIVSDIFKRPGDTTIYALSDCVGMNLAITDATNASPIRLTIASHGFPAGLYQPMTIASVGGNTNANGDRIVKIIDDTHVDLYSDDGVTPIAGNGAYTSGGTAAVLLRFRNIARVNGGSGRITGARIVLNSAVTGLAQFRLYLYSVVPSATLDNAQLPLLWANRANRIGHVDFSLNTEGTGSDSVSDFQPSVNIEYVCGASSKDLYGVLVAKALYVPTSGELGYVELRSERNERN